MSKPEEYKKAANMLGAKRLFGRWGIAFLLRTPEGHVDRRFKILPLDGWFFGEDMEKEMEKRNYEL